MCLDLQFLLDGVWGDDDFALLMREIVDVDWQLGGAQVVVVLDSVRVLVTQHVRGYGFDVVLLDKGCEVKDTHIAVLVTQDQPVLLVNLFVFNVRDLRGLLDAVHVLPLSK